MNRYELSEHELSEPLSEYDSQRLENYRERVSQRDHPLGMAAAMRQQIADQKRKATSFEQKQLTELEEQSSQYFLEPWEEADLAMLRARYYQQSKLADYRWEVHDSAFANFNPPRLENWCGGLNLPDMIEKYERTKIICNTTKARQSFARRKQDEVRKNLAQLDQSDSILWQRLDPKSKLSEAQKVILSEIVGELFEKYIQHVEQDANLLPLAVAKSAGATLNSEEYNAIYLARSVEAEAHDQEVEKLKKSKGYADWYQMQREEPHSLIKSGNGHQPFYYPRPYSEKYFWRFLNLIMRIPFAKVKPELRHQFFGDNVDRDYIETLLLQAEHELHLNTEGCVVLANDRELLAFPEPHSKDGWAFGKYPEGLTELRDMAYFGGNDFKVRAALIRDWCQEMASVTSQTLSDFERAALLKDARLALDTVEAPTISETEQSNPTPLPPAEPNTIEPTRAMLSTTRKNKALATGQDPRDESVELDEFLISTSTRVCDILAEAVGFRPPAATRKHPVVRNFEKVGDGPTARIYAIADFLDLKNLVQARKKTRLVIAMGKRLGYPNSAPANTKGGEYDSASTRVKKAFADELKSLEDDKARAQNKTE